MSKPAKLEKNSNGYWEIRWTDGRRSKRVSTRTRDLAQAQIFFSSWLSLEDASAPLVALTCAEVWQLYWDGHVRRKNDLPRSQANADYCWRNLSEHFGDVPVRNVTDALVHRYRDAREIGRIGRPSKPATVRHELILLRAAINWCAKRKYIQPADVPFFELPPDSEPRDRWLTQDEIERYLAEVRRRADRSGKQVSRLWLFSLIALNTGARKSAIMALTWDRVDFQRQLIDFAVPGRRKTKKRAGVVPMNDALRDALEQAYQHRSSSLVLGSQSDMHEAIADAAEAAGVGRIGPHVFRHTYATHAVMRGVSIFQVAKILGITVTVAERTYAKHAPDWLREQVNAVQFGAQTRDSGAVCGPDRSTTARHTGPNELETLDLLG